MESMEPSMELSMDPNQTQLPVSMNSIQPSIATTDASSIYNSIELSSNETGSEDNETQSPSPSISEKDTRSSLQCPKSRSADSGSGS